MTSGGGWSVEVRLGMLRPIISQRASRIPPRRTTGRMRSTLVATVTWYTHASIHYVIVVLLYLETASGDADRH